MNKKLSRKFTNRSRKLKRPPKNRRDRREPKSKRRLSSRRQSIRNGWLGKRSRKRSLSGKMLRLTGLLKSKPLRRRPKRLHS